MDIPKLEQNTGGLPVTYIETTLENIVVAGEISIQAISMAKS